MTIELIVVPVTILRCPGCLAPVTGDTLTHDGMCPFVTDPRP